MVVAAFSHLALSVADLKVSRAFYVEVFGFVAGEPYSAAGRRVAALMEADPAGFDGLFLRLGDTLVELLAHRTPHAAGVPRPVTELGIAHLSFAVDDLDAALARVESAGGSSGTRIDQRFGDGGEPTGIAFCFDPDGNRVELIAHVDRAAVRRHAGFLGLGGLGWPGAECLR